MKLSQQLEEVEPIKFESIRLGSPYVDGASYERMKSVAIELAKACEIISKNKTVDRDVYTLGCDCDEETKSALTLAAEILKGEV